MSALTPAGTSLGGFCSDAARASGDSLTGTALVVTRFLLIEQPGPWGWDPLVQSRLDPVVGLAVAARARDAGMRVLLVRRPGRHVASPAGDPVSRSWFVVDTSSGHQSVRRGSFLADGELLSLPLDGAAGSSEVGPLLLVCTNGRHDTCCAKRGRPMAAALARLRPGRVWECSHVGGDRFAPNLVVLPEGLYYGGLDPASALEVVAAYEAGRLVPRWLRGRCSLQPAVQAAQVHAAATLGRDRLDDLGLVTWSFLGRRTWRVVLGTSSPVVATVRATTGAPRLLTCRATTDAAPLLFTVVDLSVLVDG